MTQYATMIQAEGGYRVRPKPGLTWQNGSAEPEVLAYGAVFTLYSAGGSVQLQVPNA